MRKILLRTFLVGAITCSALMSKALGFPGSGGPGSGGPGGGNHHDAPIDGGASLLIGTGIVYGIKKAYNSRKKATKVD
jgi:hypothetical protein